MKRTGEITCFAPSGEVGAGSSIVVNNGFGGGRPMMGGDSSPSTESPNQASGIYNSDGKSEYATVIYYYDAKEEDELTLRVGDVIEVRNM